MSQNISEIIKALSNLKVEVKARFKAEIKGIFGSFVRTEEKPDSDIDVLVEFLPTANLFDMAELTLFLEEKLHRTIDVVPECGIRPELKQNILREVVRL